MNILSFLKRYQRLLRPFVYLYYRRKFGKLCRFWYSSHLSYRCEFEGMNMVAPHASFYGRMGLGSYLGTDSHLNADIGRFCSIAGGVTCVNATHPMREPFATTSPLFYSLENSKTPERTTFATRQMATEFRTIDERRGIDVSIGNDVWIGQAATILGGVRIADGAVVLANAWVTKDVPPYAIVGGTPAKIISYRYDEATIQFLLRVRWWENSREWMEKHWELLCNMDALKKYYKEEMAAESSSSS